MLSVLNRHDHFQIQFALRTIKVQTSLLGCVIQSATLLFTAYLSHISLVSFLWDIGKQNRPRCDAAKRGVPSGAILFADMIIIEKLNKNEKSLLEPLKMKVDSSI